MEPRRHVPRHVSHEPDRAGHGRVDTRVVLRVVVGRSHAGTYDMRVDMCRSSETCPQTKP